MCDFLTLTNASNAGTLITLFYSIWKGQNNMLFCHQHATSMGSMLRRVIELRPSLVAANLLVWSISTELPLIWARPPLGVVNVNFDAFISPSRVPGFYFLCRMPVARFLQQRLQLPLQLYLKCFLRPCAFIEPFLWLLTFPPVESVLILHVCYCLRLERDLPEDVLIFLRLLVTIMIYFLLVILLSYR